MNTKYTQLSEVVEFLSEARQVRRLEQYALSKRLPETRNLHMDHLRGRVQALYDKYSLVLSGTPEWDYFNALRQMYTQRQPEPIVPSIVPSNVGEAVYLPETRQPKYEGLDRKVDELDLSIRASNCLHVSNFRTVGELAQKTEGELLKTKNFGKKPLKEIKKVLESMGLRLGMTPDELYETS